MPELSSHGGIVSNMRCVFQGNAGAPRCPNQPQTGNTAVVAGTRATVHTALTHNPLPAHRRTVTSVQSSTVLRDDRNRVTIRSSRLVRGSRGAAFSLRFSATLTLPERI